MPSSPPALHLFYTSSSNAPFSASIPVGPDSSSPSKSTEANAELPTLRAAMSTLQTRMNNELMMRMKEDKATAAAAEGELQVGKDGKPGMEARKGKVDTGGEEKMAIDEDAEEQSYGEEVVEED